MKTSPLIAVAAALALAGCSGTDRPAPTGAQVQAENQQRQQALANNPAIPPEARARVEASVNSGKH